MSSKKSLRDSAGQAGDGAKSKCVFVAMSGGVDSSVTALLLKNEGYDVVGIFMRCYNLDGCSEQDALDARRVAEHIGIPFYVWDFEEDYKKHVVKYMVDGYRRGITPNPDVMCNKEIKFGLFFEKALAAGADYVATGHYVRLRRISDKRSSDKENGRKKIMSHVACRMSLFEARDTNKDQSYFLWTLTQRQLKHCLFPIGKYEKPEVRAIARKAGLPTAGKKDSQGICFLGKVSLSDFLKQYIPEKRGALLTTSGETIGEHAGATFYTIGQRHLGASYDVKSPKLKGSKERKPFYVVEKDVKKNTVVVAEGSDNPALCVKEVELTDANFIDTSLAHSIELTNEGISVLARVRYRQPLAKARLVIKRQATQKKKDSMSHVTRRILLAFDKPQKFVAPGQSAVFYLKNGQMLGGGIIVD